MATKEENVRRLLELAEVLGREPDMSGSTVEIQQRVAEWEEEALACSGSGGEYRDDKPAGECSGLTEARARVTQHMDAFTADGVAIDNIVPAGMTVWIPDANIPDLEAAGLISLI